MREQLHCIYEVNPTAGKPSAKLTSAGIRTGGIEGEIREGLYILDCHLATYIRYQGALLWTKLLQVGESCAVPGATASEKISTAGQRTLYLQRLGFMLQVAKCDLFILGLSILASPMRARSRNVSKRPLSERAAIGSQAYPGYLSSLAENEARLW